METFYHHFLGPFIFISLLLGLALVVVIPKTRLAKYCMVSERYFILTHLCGIVCGLLGLLAIFLLPEETVSRYWWKILILPFVYMELYLLAPMIAQGTTAIFDEKQTFNLGTAGGMTLGATIIIMASIVVPLLHSGFLELTLLYPFYLNVVLLLFSSTTLVLFKRA